MSENINSTSNPDWKTEITVAAVIERDGKFLVVEEMVSDHLVYNQPAGHLDEHETLVEAVVRETYEETAYTFEPEAITGIYVWKSPRRGTTIMRTAFCGQVVAHDSNAKLDDGIRQAVWLSRDELEKSARLRSPFVLRCIDDYLSGTRHPVSLVNHLGV